MRADPLAAKCQELMSETLRDREHSIISTVCRAIASNETLDPTYAVQQWLALNEIRQLKRSLETSERMHAREMAKRDSARVGP